MKKIISNLSVMIFVIGCVIMEITTWFIDSYVMFYIGIIIVIVGTIGMIIQGKFKKVIEFIIEYFLESFAFNILISALISLFGVICEFLQKMLIY